MRRAGPVARGRLGCLALVLALLGPPGLGAAPAAAAELRRLEVVGAVPADPGTGGAAGRSQAALEVALQEAVTRVARGLVVGPGGGEPTFDARAVLGDDPTRYAVRFRILEDRGERRALLVSEPGVAMEHVVLVEVHVDVDRVRARLAEAGLLAAASAPDEGAFDLELLELASARAYSEIRRALLDDAGALEVVPREIQPGWAVLVVRAPAGRLATVEALLEAPLAEGIALESLPGAAGTARLRVLEDPAPPLETDPGAEAGAASDPTAP